MSFNCTKCGLCCANVKKALDRKENHPYKELLDDFPFAYDESGACEKLNKQTNECTVYDSRPEICNVETVYARFHRNITKEEFFKLNEDACHSLQQDILIL